MRLVLLRLLLLLLLLVLLLLLLLLLSLIVLLLFTCLPAAYLYFYLYSTLVPIFILTSLYSYLQSTLVPIFHLTLTHTLTHILLLIELLLFSSYSHYRFSFSTTGMQRYVSNVGKPVIAERGNPIRQLSLFNQ